MSSLPETILQFGAGRFLRAFVERFVQQANDSGQEVGRVVVVQSTPGARAELLKNQPEGYGVLVRGYEGGQLVERLEKVTSISRALLAASQWDEVQQVACSAALRWIVTNATEAGYQLEESDTLESQPPAAMPAKLTQLLWLRFRSGGAPVTLLPCELIERNADRLQELVLSLAERWGLPTEFSAWVRGQCRWLNNLVDCIVTNPPAELPLAATDPLLVCAEPYALWAIERPTGGTPPLFTHPAIHLVDDLSPYYLRKVRILNGLHTAMAAKYSEAGFETVKQLLDDRAAVIWLRGLLYEEIVPTIAYRVEDVALFADQTWERLRNPFLHHRLQDIARYQTEKVRVRLQPTYEEYVRLFGKPPRRLSEVVKSE